MRAHACTNSLTCACTYTHKHTCIHTHTPLHAETHMRSHTYTHTRIHACTRTYTHTHTHTHTQTHTHTHTHSHRVVVMAVACGLQPEITEIILMGGGSRLPRVQELLLKYSGKYVAVCHRHCHGNSFRHWPCITCTAGIDCVHCFQACLFPTWCVHGPPPPPHHHHMIQHFLCYIGVTFFVGLCPLSFWSLVSGFVGESVGSWTVLNSNNISADGI